MLTLLSKVSRLVQRDITFWINQYATSLILVDHKLVSLNIFSTMTKKASWTELAPLGPFVSMDTACFSRSSCVLEAAKYHPSILGNEAKTITEQVFTGYSPFFFHYTYAFCELSALPNFFVTYELVAQQFLPLLTQTWMDMKSRSDKFELAMFLLGYKLHYPNATLPFSFDEILQTCMYCDRIRVWVLVHVQELLCAWWEHQLISINYSDQWSSFITFLTMFGIFTPPRIVTVLVQVHLELQKQQYIDMAHDLHLWLQNVCIFFNVVQDRFTDVQFQFQS